jgi:hypothetical protein
LDAGETRKKKVNKSKRDHSSKEIVTQIGEAGCLIFIYINKTSTVMYKFRDVTCSGG